MILVCLVHLVPWGLLLFPLHAAWGERMGFSGMGHLVPLVEGRESLTYEAEDHFPGWTFVVRLPCLWGMEGTSLGAS